MICYGLDDATCRARSANAQLHMTAKHEELAGSKKATIDPSHQQTCNCMRAHAPACSKALSVHPTASSNQIASYHHTLTRVLPGRLVAVVGVKTPGWPRLQGSPDQVHGWIANSSSSGTACSWGGRSWL